MADSTKPGLAAVVTPATTDLLSVRQSGDTRDKKETVAQVLSHLSFDPATGTITLVNGAKILFSTVSGAPQLLRSGASFRVELNTGTATGATVVTGAFMAEDGSAPSNFGDVQLGNAKTLRISDGTDYNRGLTVQSSVLKSIGPLRVGDAIERGITSSAGVASTTEYPNAGDWGFHINTTLGTISIAINHAGTVKGAVLPAI